MSIGTALRLMIVMGGFVLLAEVLSLLPPPPVPLALDNFIHYCTIFALPFVGFLLVLRHAPGFGGMSKIKRRLLLCVASLGLMLLADFTALAWVLRFGGRSKFPY